MGSGTVTGPELAELDELGDSDELGELGVSDELDGLDGWDELGASEEEVEDSPPAPEQDAKPRDSAKAANSVRCLFILYTLLAWVPKIYHGVSVYKM